MLEHEYTPDDFIDQRVKQYQDWYDKKSVVAKSRYILMRGFSVVAGGLVPVLINISYEPVFYGVPIIKFTVTVISLLVAVFVSLESVLHYREQWKNYRSTEQALGHETIFFKSGIGVYRNLSPNDAFKLFVERVEDAIRAENAATLNIMTMANEPSATSADRNSIRHS